MTKIVSIEKNKPFPQHDLNPDVVLENTKGRLKSFTIIGYDHDGEEYFASTQANPAETLWSLERLKAILLQGDD